MSECTAEALAEQQKELQKQLTQLQSNYQREVDSVYAHNDSFPNDKRPLPLREITGEEIIMTARQLNEFVTEK